MLERSNFLQNVMCNLLPIHSLNSFLGSPAPDGAHASPLRVVSLRPDGSSHRQVPAGSALFPRSQSAHTATTHAVSRRRNCLARSDCCHDGGLSVGFGGGFHNAKQARTPTQFYFSLSLGTTRTRSGTLTALNLRTIKQRVCVERQSKAHT